MTKALYLVMTIILVGANFHLWVESITISPEKAFCLIDSDHDGFYDIDDNCDYISNPLQRDGDRDGIGDICDNCPKKYNPLQGSCDSNWVKRIGLA